MAGWKPNNYFTISLSADSWSCELVNLMNLKFNLYLCKQVGSLDLSHTSNQNYENGNPEITRELWFIWKFFSGLLVLSDCASFCLTLQRGLIKLDETRTKNSRMKCDKEIGRILHTRAKKITSAKKGRRLKDDTGVPSCTSVIPLMSHCCFSITLLLGQVLEEGKKSKTRSIDVSLSLSSFHRSSQKPWSIDHDIVLVLLFFIRR